MDNREKILEKLRKLMNLKESAIAIGNEGEANAAAAGISRLLMLYNLSESDIPEQERIENPVISECIPYKITECNGVWYSQLIAVICEYNMCRSLAVSTYKIDKGRMSRDKYQIVGRKKNVEVALYLISFLSHVFISSGKAKYNEGLRNGSITLTKAAFMKSFLYGCVVGLSLKLREEKNELNQDGKVTALAVCSNKEINDFLNGVKISKGYQAKPKLQSSEGFNSGVLTGKNVDIHKGIYADSVNEERRLTTKY